MLYYSSCLINEILINSTTTKFLQSNYSNGKEAIIQKAMHIKISHAVGKETLIKSILSKTKVGDDTYLLFLETGSFISDSIPETCIRS